MTATEMSNAFAQKINLSHSTSVPSWDRAFWLNIAQDVFLNGMIESNPQMPRIAIYTPVVPAGEKFIWDAHCVAPFQKAKEVITDDTGFYALEDLIVKLFSITTIGVKVEKTACENCEMFLKEAFYDTSDQIYASMSNLFEKPVHESESIPKRYWYSYKWTLLDKNKTGVQVFPKGRRYQIEIRYIALPRRIAVQNPQDELQYSMIPGFVVTPVDIDCEFPEKVHNRIVDLAVSLFLKSVKDSNYPIEIQAMQQKLS